VTVLGLRFPKLFEHAFMSASNTPATNAATLSSLSGTPYAFGLVSCVIPIATARYSEVRKVVFYCSVRNASITAKCRLKVAAMSSSSSSIVPQPFTLAPSQLVRTVGSGGVFTNTGPDVDHLFTKAGSTTVANVPNNTNMIDGATVTLTIEFDRFLADSADFFAYWDSQVSANSYLGFRLVVERTDTNWGASTNEVATFADVGVSIVQAPGVNNKSVTLVPGTVGYINDSVMATAYPQLYRGRLFRYVAANWDHITSVNLLSYCFWANNATRTFRVGLHNLTSYAPNAFNLLYEEQFADNAAGRAAGDVMFCRSADVKSFLVDGADHCILYDNQNAGSISEPMTWFEIIQEGYSLTECHHDGGNQYRVDSTPTLYGSPACPPFDPLWYQSFPDDRIVSRHLFLAHNHISTVIQTTTRLHLDANLESNVTGLSGTSTTIVGISPQLTSTPSAAAGTKTVQASFSPDPINLAGVRKIVWGIVVGTGSGTDDLIGTGELVYVLNVPASEEPEIGTIFETGAFNPEGCASTAAGLGDPGVLVMTNGQTLPQKFDPVHDVIEDAGIEPPFCDETLPTSVVHDTASSPDGGLGIGTYVYRYTFRNCCTGKESNPNDADIVVDTSGASPAAEVTLNFTNVRIPGDPQICEICLYRTVLDGAYPVLAKVGCFDPDTTSTFTDVLSDADLDFTNNGLSLLNAPMPCVPIVVDFANRLFGMGDIPDLSPAGTVSAVQGSDIITGDFDVEWTRCLEGKYIQLEGDCRSYEIACVMPPAVGTSPAFGQLKLTENYEGTDTTGKLYTICGRPNRMMWSEPFEAEYWPEANFLDIEPGDGDRLMGAVSNFDSLVICKRRKTYVLRYSTTPSEVFVPARISSDIGCIAPRSFAQVESGSVWLSDRGLALFDGRSVDMIPESVAFSEMFTDPDDPDYVRRDSNGRVIGACAVYYPKRQQYLILLPTVQTDRGANLVMVWDTQLRNITLHRYCQEFLAIAIGKDSDGNQRVYAGDSNGFVWILDIGDSDGVGFPGQTGTVTGTVTATGTGAGLGASFIEDENASFLEGGLPALAGLSGITGLSGAFDGTDLGLAGVCVFYRAADAAPDDPWSVRTVFAASEHRLFVTPSFTTDAPPVGYDYMIGPIDFRAEFKPTNYGDDDVLKRDWRHALVYEPETVSSVVRVQLIPDFQNSDDEEGTIENEVGDVGAGRTFDLSYNKGRQTRPVGRRIFDFEQVIITNFAPEQPIRILNHVLMVEPHISK